MTLLVLPLNALLGGVMFVHQKRVFGAVQLRVRRNGRGLLFYFLGYQFVMAPISGRSMNGSRFSARRVTSSDWILVYLRIPLAPWRVPSPDAFQPPIGRFSAE